MKKSFSVLTRKFNCSITNVKTVLHSVILIRLSRDFLRYHTFFSLSLGRLYDVQEIELSRIAIILRIIAENGVA